MRDEADASGVATRVVCEACTNEVPRPTHPCKCLCVSLRRMVPACIDVIIGNLKVWEASAERVASEERPHTWERFDMVFVDWSEYFEWCAGCEVDSGCGFKRADVGATKDDVDAELGQTFAGCRGLAASERSKFAVDWRAGEPGVRFRLGVAD